MPACHFAPKFFFLTSLCLSWCANSVLAADNTPSGSVDEPLFVVKSRQADMTEGGSADRLLRRAAKKGAVHVIVGIRSNPRPDATVTKAEEEAEAVSLKRLQGDVIKSDLDGNNTKVHDLYTFIPFMSVYANESQLRKLLADPNVISLEEDVPRHLQVENAVKLDTHQGTARPSGVWDGPWDDTANFIHASDVWKNGPKGSGQVVTILDSGVEKTNPALNGAVISEACYSTQSAVDGTQKLCERGSTRPGSGANCTVSPDCAHGTHVAAIAAGRPSGKFKGGVSPGAEIISIQIMSKDLADGRLTWTQSDLLAGLQRVFFLKGELQQKGKNIAAVNLSIEGETFGGMSVCDMAGTHYMAIAAAAARLLFLGTPVVAASGNQTSNNEQKTSEPACYSSVISVGNSRKNDTVFASSNHSFKVGIVAPGTEVLSAIPGRTFGYMTGTSMAAPHVSGAFALLRSANRSKTTMDILRLFQTTGPRSYIRTTVRGEVKLPDPNPYRLDLLSDYSCLVKLPLRSWDFNSELEMRDWFTNDDWEKRMERKWSVANGSLISPAPSPSSVPTGARLPGCYYQNSEVTIRVAGVNRGGGSSDDTVSVSINGVSLTFLNRLASSDRPWLQFMNGPDGKFCRNRVPVAINKFNTISLISDGLKRHFSFNRQHVCSITLQQPTDAANSGFLLGSSNNPDFRVYYDFIEIKPK